MANFLTTCWEAILTHKPRGGTFHIMLGDRQPADTYPPAYMHTQTLAIHLKELIPSPASQSMYARAHAGNMPMLVPVLWIYDSCGPGKQAFAKEILPGG